MKDEFLMKFGVFLGAVSSGPLYLGIASLRGNLTNAKDAAPIWARAIVS